VGISTEDWANWQRLVAADRAFTMAQTPLGQRLARIEFNHILKHLLGRPYLLVELIRVALMDPPHRSPALKVLLILTGEEQQQLFRELLWLASFEHDHRLVCQGQILALPRAWVLGQIEAQAQVFLVPPTYEAYRSLLELYLQLDHALTRRLVDQALLAFGEDFFEQLRRWDGARVAG